MALDSQKIEAVLTLIEGGESERAACETVGINRMTFRSQALKLGAASQYARACEGLALDQVEKLETVIAEMRAGTVAVDVARVEIDARKWLASKLWKPTWGDKLAVVGGDPAQGDQPIQVTNRDRAKAVAALIAKSRAGARD